MLREDEESYRLQLNFSFKSLNNKHGVSRLVLTSHWSVCLHTRDRSVFIWSINICQSS